jgi:hypothetical protein
MSEGCVYGGASFSENEAICSDETSFNCFNGEWLAQGSPCGANDKPVNPNVEPAIPGSTSENIGNLSDSTSNLCLYNGRTYSEGALICLDGTSYRCSFGKWSASGSCSPRVSESRYETTSESTSTEAFDLCLGDGGGALITSPRDARAKVKVCGRFHDLVSYWYDGARLIYDPIRDGDDLEESPSHTGDILFPGAVSSQLPNPPFSVRHGRDRDLVRVYAPPKPGKSATVNRYEPRIGTNMNVGWLDAERVQAGSETFVYDPGENAFIRQGVPRNMQDIRSIGG